MPRTPFTEARRNPVAGVHGTIVLAIGEDIVRGTIKPGERLPQEAALIERFRASRTAIREAMKVLAAKGLVRARQRAGTKVRPRAEWDLLDADVLSWHDPDTINDTLVGDLVELRQFLEPKAARLAAQRATEEDIETMQAAHEKMAGAAADPTDKKLGLIDEVMSFEQALHNFEQEVFSEDDAHAAKARLRLAQSRSV